MAKRLGELLVEKNIISQSQLDQGLTESKKTGDFLGKAMIKMGLITEDQMLQVLSEQMKMPYVDLSRVQIQEEAVKRVSGKLVWDYKFMPIRLKGNILTIAIDSGTAQNVMICSKLQSVLGVKLELTMAKEADIEGLIKKYYTTLADSIEKLLSDGFTLIELIIVISIMSIIIGITAPRWTRTLDYWRFQVKVNDFVNSIRYARERAIVDRKERKIIISDSLFPSGTIVDADENEIVFNANGETEETDIKLTSKDGRKIEMKVLGWGKVKLETLK